MDLLQVLDRTHGTSNISTSVGLACRATAHCTFHLHIQLHLQAHSPLVVPQEATQWPGSCSPRPPQATLQTSYAPTATPDPTHNQEDSSGSCCSSSSDPTRLLDPSSGAAWQSGRSSRTSPSPQGNHRSHTTNHSATRVCRRFLHCSQHN